MSATRMFRKLETRPGSEGGSSVTAGLSSVGTPTYALLDMAVYGRQETWEDSPSGWPQVFGTNGEQFRTNGRPTAQWSRLAVGRSDDLGAADTSSRVR
jgi:hypothetical protein